jgi:anaerobic selenocysteine-containing dehydrogenase
MPYKTSLAILKGMIKEIYRTGKGMVISEGFEESWAEFLKQRGWQSLRYTNFEEFWKVLIKNGGWWEPRHLYGRPRKLFRKRFNFSAANRINRQLQPRFKETKEEPSFSLNVSRNLTNYKGKGSNSPLLQEIFGFYHKQYWKTYLEINPETAKNLGLRDGDVVEVESAKGRLRCPVKIYAGIRPDVVNIPFGLGHTAYGRYAKGIGVNPYTILIEDNDELSDLPDLIGTKVSIRKV